MPIKFTIVKESNYFIAKWEGKINDAEIMEAYREFFEDDEWTPGMNELADFSQSNLTDVKSHSFDRLGQYIHRTYKKNNVADMKCASYAPEDLAFGLLRLYELITDDDSPETTKVFKNIDEAEQWLTSLTNDNQ